MVALCSLTIFVSALLLFAVQPMVAKMLLPVLGGSPSVWNTAMVFYQGALLMGYLYAHLVVKRLSPKKQLISHAVLLVLPFVVLPLAYHNLTPPATSNPAPWMLLTMATSVGLPFFVLSATSPLVQSWFSRAGGGDPYFLYAASNIGSFVGLLAYPLLIEPKLSVTSQSGDWTIGYVLLLLLFGATMAAVAKRFTNVTPVEEAEPERLDEDEPSEPPRSELKRRLRWLFLAFVPSSLFIGVTTYLTTDIVVMPLLWVIPLSIYLLSMVLVFAKRPPIPHKLIVKIFPLGLAALVFTIATRSGQFKFISFGAHLLMLFVGCMLCHGELARDRPKPSRLTEFFLIMSVGGVLGGLFNALVAPLVFVHVVEYVIALTLLALGLPSRNRDSSSTSFLKDLAIPSVIVVSAMAVIWLQLKGGYLPEYATSIAIGVAALLIVFLSARPLRFAVGILGLLVMGVYSRDDGGKEIYSSRSFFGVYRVLESDGWHSLTNGRILHGGQAPYSSYALEPQTYYHRLGPLKEVLKDWPREAGAEVAAIGLGTGTLALWSKPGEHWTFFEIDPAVEKIARDTKLFTCIENAKGRVSVTIGDARLSLSQTDQKFDLILMDAFSSDAIPGHLMTLEAMKVYQSRLRPGGRVAVHISNRYLKLEPVVTALTDQMGWKAYICDESVNGMQGEDIEVRSAATWMLIGPPELDWSPITSSSRWRVARRAPGIEGWTDAYSSLLPVLRPEAFSISMR